MQVVGIVGRKGHGKTHLVVRLIGELRRRGLRVSTLKHTHHHDFQIDQPGKDSDRHRAAGAQEVLIACDTHWALIARPQHPVRLAELISRLAACDVVLVEGYKGVEQLARIEVFRGISSDGPLAAADPGIAAIACAPHARVDAARCPRLALDDTAAIADFLLQLPAVAPLALRP
jgi:molybdopterin-guanine dinucleotide biosynthesis protein MobB